MVGFQTFKLYFTWCFVCVKNKNSITQIKDGKFYKITGMYIKMYIFGSYLKMIIRSKINKQ